MSMNNGTTPGASSADEAIDLLYAWMPPQAAPQPCPEACFSLTLKGRLDGQEALLTARGQTAAEFKANLEAMRGLLDAPTAPPASRPPQGQGAGVVPEASDDDAGKSQRGPVLVVAQDPGRPVV